MERKVGAAIRGRTLGVRRLNRLGGAALVVGAVLVGSAMAASAAGPSITIQTASPDVSQGTAVLADGTGFTKNAPSPGAFMECSTASPQPTVTVTGFTTPVPVSCSNPITSAAKVNKAGKIGFTGMQIAAGTVGPPQSGADTGTGSSGVADTDAANFPCPPFPDQVTAGAGCEILYLDDAGQSASQPLTFTTASTPPTTAPTTTTTAPCQSQSKTVTATPPDGTATVTLDKDTCLEAGTQVTVTATGLFPANSKTNEVGTVLECNDDPGQPTVELEGNAFPVSCTSATATYFIPNASGTLTQKFTVIVGPTGPPTSGTASDGNDAAADAAKYPCPPTPAQTSDTCVIAVADQGGDKVVVPIAFNPGGVGTNAPTSPAGSSGSNTTKAATKASAAATTKAASGALAFTGSGPGLWWLGMIGVALMLVGGLVLMVLDEPRRLLRVVRRSR